MIAIEVARNPKDFDCEACKHRYCDNDNPAPFPKWEIPGVITSNICLKPMVTEASQSYMSLYRHYKNNIMAVSGGILDQPYKYRVAMEIIDGQ